MSGNTPFLPEELMDSKPEDSGEQKFYLKDVVAQDAEGYAVYKKLLFDMNLNDECLYYYNGYKTVQVKYIDYEFKLHTASYSDKVLKEFVSLNNWQSFNRLLVRHKKFMASPQILNHAFVATENLSHPKGYILREDLMFLSVKDMAEIATTPKIEIDLPTGQILCYSPLRKILREDDELIMELLRIIFPEPSELKSFLDFLSLYAFENRYGLAKPTFIMYGSDRGTGKNLIFESLIGSIYDGQVCPLPPNYDKFTGYLEKKFVYIDENNEASLDPIHLYNFVKRMSGQRFNPVNRKGIESKTKLNGTFFGIASNEKALNIRDFVTDPAQNQFFVINTIGTKHPAISEFKKKIGALGYGGVVDLIEKSLGHFIFYVLFPIYEQLKLDNKRTGFRYGMEVPISEGLVKLINLSVSSSDKSIIQMLDNLATGNRTEYHLTPELGYHFVEFSNKQVDAENGFLTTKLIKSLCKQEKVNDTAFYLFLDKYSLVKSAKFRRYVYGTKPTGLLIDFTRLEYLSENNAWAGREEGYDTDSNSGNIYDELIGGDNSENDTKMGDEL
jgi:hypothetical protein